MILINENTRYVLRVLPERAFDGFERIVLGVERNVVRFRPGAFFR